MQGRTKYIENNNNYTFDGDCGIVRAMMKNQNTYVGCELYAGGDYR